MALVCVNHPALDAESVCMQCGKAICDACKSRVNNRPACPACADVPVPEIAEPEPVMPLASAAVPTASTIMAHGVPDLDGSPYYAQPNDGLTLNGILRGLAFGLVVALIGALIWEKIAFYTSKQFFYLNAIAGGLTGAVVVAGTKKHGVIPAVIGGSCAIVAMVLAHWLLFYDIVSRMAAAEGGTIGLLGVRLDVALRACASFEVIHWVGIALCIGFAAFVSFKEGKRR